MHPPNIRNGSGACSNFHAPHAPLVLQRSEGELLIQPAYRDVVGRRWRYPAAPMHMPDGVHGIDMRDMGWHFLVDLFASALFGNVGAMWEASALPSGCLVARVPGKAGG